MGCFLPLAIVSMLHEHGSAGVSLRYPFPLFWVNAQERGFMAALFLVSRGTSILVPIQCFFKCRLLLNVENLSPGACSCMFTEATVKLLILATRRTCCCSGLNINLCHLFLRLSRVRLPWGGCGKLPSVLMACLLWNMFFHSTLPPDPMQKTLPKWKHFARKVQEEQPGGRVLLSAGLVLTLG